MKMRTHKIYSVLFSMLLLVLWSCNDDFVDVASQDENSEEFFNSEEDYQNALIGAYDLFNLLI